MQQNENRNQKVQTGDIPEGIELWRTCEHIVSLEVEGNGFDYSYFQCSLTACVYPEWKCPCDNVANLGGVPDEKNQILT